MDDNFKVQFNPGSGMIVIVVIGIIVLFVLFKSVVVIPAGHVGITDLFGKVSDGVLTSGMHVINPLKKATRMSIQTRELKETAEVPSKEGLIVSLDLSLLFSLNPTMAPHVYKTIGLNYIQIVAVPQLRSVVRGVTAGFEVKQLYSSEGREEISALIFKKLAANLSKRGITTEKILLRSIILPTKISQSIERKLEEEQRKEQMKFVIERERQEAERKRIEAKGIADFQRIVAKGISNNLLKWKGIEATENLAKSNNTKIIIIGNSQDGLPIILGGTGQ